MQAQLHPKIKNLKKLKTLELFKKKFNPPSYHHRVLSQDYESLILKIYQNNIIN